MFSAKLEMVKKMVQPFEELAFHFFSFFSPGIELCSQSFYKIYVTSFTVIVLIQSKIPQQI